MPIVTDTEDDTPINDPDPVVLEPTHDSITIDTKRHKINSLLVNIEGSSWTVRYFSQILAEDSQVAPLQLDLPAVYQQYTAIEGLELKVISPLSHLTDLPDSYANVTGAATVYPHLIPNQGDMFIADVGDGRDGLFTITNVERKTILKETCHEISYQMVNYATDVYLDNLQEKTIKSVHFKRDYLVNGQNPFLMDNEANLIDEMGEHYDELLSQYVVEFFDRSYKTLLVPNDEYTLYDHFLMKTFRNVFTTDEHSLIRSIEAMNCDGDDEMFVYTFWDCLLEMDNTLMSVINNKMRVIHTRLFTRAPLFRGISFSGIDRMLYPDDNLEASDPPPAPLTETPNIHPTDYDDYYVFSESFYRDLDGKSLLEIELTKALNEEAMSHSNLDVLARDIHNWSSLSRFYYVPVILILLKVALRRL